MGGQTNPIDFALDLSPMVLFPSKAVFEVVEFALDLCTINQIESQKRATKKPPPQVGRRPQELHSKVKRGWRSMADDEKQRQSSMPESIGLRGQIYRG